MLKATEGKNRCHSDIKWCQFEVKRGMRQHKECNHRATYVNVIDVAMGSPRKSAGLAGVQLFRRAPPIVVSPSEIAQNSHSF